MEYGAENLDRLIQSEEDLIVKCNNCNTYHYESLGTSMDSYNLQLLYDRDDHEGDFPYKGCGNCKTDDFLMDLN